MKNYFQGRPVALIVTCILQTIILVLAMSLNWWGLFQLVLTIVAWYGAFLMGMMVYGAMTTNVNIAGRPEIIAAPLGTSILALLIGVAIHNTVENYQANYPAKEQATHIIDAAEKEAAEIRTAAEEKIARIKAVAEIERKTAPIQPQDLPEYEVLTEDSAIFALSLKDKQVKIYGDTKKIQAHIEKFGPELEVVRQYIRQEDINQVTLQRKLRNAGFPEVIPFKSKTRTIDFARKGFIIFED